MYVIEHEQRVARPVEAVFAFYADARNLETITPPWLAFSVLSPGAIVMRAGTLIEYRLRLHGMPLRWRTRIAVWEPPRRFVDVQMRGPYALWEHAHTFEPLGSGEVAIRDRVRYALPLGVLGRLAHALFVRRDLDRIFAYRARAVEAALG